MGRKQTIASIILVLMFTVTIAAVRFGPLPRVTGGQVVKAELPAQVGKWVGEDVFFCQNGDCMKSFKANQLNGRSVCPVCGSELDVASLPEKKSLPSDTVLMKKRYVNPDGNAVSMSVVISGTSRSSIHRPQWCLPAHGLEIRGERVMKIPLKERDALPVMMLYLTVPGAPGVSRDRMVVAVCSYWFMSEGHETPYHFKRLLWMAFDNIIRGVSQRWVYILVLIENKTSVSHSEKVMADFIADLYPEIKADLP